MSFEEKYPLRSSFMNLSDEDILDCLTSETFDYNTDLYQETLKRILEKVIKIEKEVFK